MKQKTLSELVRDEAYEKLENVSLCNAQLKVLKAIENYPDGVPDKLISQETGMPVTSVNGRRNELVALGLVEAVGWDYYPDYQGKMRKNTLWSLKGS